MDGPHSGRRRVDLKAVLEVVALVAMTVAAAVLVWNGVRSPNESRPQPRLEPVLPDGPVSVGAGPALGNATAKVGIVEFADFECPYCAVFARDTLPAIRERYVDTGAVRFMFRHLPLKNHRYARPAAAVAECADRQGRFWNLYTALFSPDQKLDEDVLRKQAERSGVDIVALDKCLAERDDASVRFSEELARSLQLRGTPAFLIGRVTNKEMRVEKIILGAKPLIEFSSTIDRLLK